MAQLLKLGYTDKGNKPTDLDEYFGWYHFGLPLPNKLRAERVGQFEKFTEINGTHVKDVQEFFREAGFYPQGDLDGIYGYRMLSATRLFQDYVRNVEGNTDIGKPDGVIGNNTYRHIERWKAEKIQADWTDISMHSPSDEFMKWINMLNKIQAKYTYKPTKILEMVNNYTGKSDTKKVADWDFHPKHIHLLGVRRKEWEKTGKRANDDVFILLINGMVFKFYGSTDPSQSMASRPDEPFLVHGQHDYGFGWHKLGRGGKKAYRAFRPAKDGVLIFRDINNDNSFTEVDTENGMEPNRTINIHWTGHGTSVWSAGCQVICGKSYINHRGQKIDCTPYSSPGYQALGDKTKGAYNVIADLISAFAEPDTHVAKYTLLYEEDLATDPLIGGDYAKNVLDILLEK
jgi:hypothetical protein